MSEKSKHTEELALTEPSASKNRNPLPIWCGACCN